MPRNQRKEAFDLKGSIDRNSYEPAYVQLMNLLKSQIASGQFPPGSRLPSEAQLCKKYNISPMTVRRSINLLIDQGMVDTTQGKGTFVKPIALSSVNFSLTEFVDILKEDGASVRLLELNAVKASPEAAAHLAIDPGDRIIYIRRLIYLDKDPVLYHQEQLVCDPKRPIVEDEMEVTSLKGLFTGLNQSGLKKGQVAINATQLSDQEAGWFRLPMGSPAIRLEHLFFDFADQPVSWGWFVCHSERVLFRAAVGPW
ncbi:transcriptional regulator, GntR family [Desulfatibacillum aliphaticivorans]|uniref:Transcriptional regulator, GntR family n=1 Tax=Desulfatibacillum aliphaticivorans TaxID=218208 RepID=B8FKB6_DESAL|nr:GntR family transcriptional regulator [Desulfatibacillum aliphaticivorans]ACL01731.1 transcriptional regulator, GntR family [Desulfatibacillum aliphaticivorans]